MNSVLLPSRSVLGLVASLGLLLLPRLAAGSGLVDAIHLVLDPATHGRHVPELATGETFQVHAVVDQLSAPTLQSFQLGLEHDESLVALSVVPHPDVSLFLQPTNVDVYAGFEPYLLTHEGPHVLATWTFTRVAGFDATHPGHVRMRKLPNGEAPQYVATIPADHRAPLRDTGPIRVGTSPPELLHFLAGPLAFVRDRAYTVEWQAHSLPNLSLDGEPVADGGSRSFVATGARVHRLEWGEGGTTESREIAVEVLDEPAIPLLVVSPPPPDRPDLFRVRWQVEGAEAVWWEPGHELVSSRGERGLTTAGPQTISLHAENEWGRTTRSVTVNGDGTPSIAMFRAEPSSIDLGAQSLLSWSCAGSDSARLEPLGLVLPPDGELAVAPRSTTTYKLHAFGGGAEAVATQEVRVVPVRVDRFEATPIAIFPGEPTTLRWSLVNASSARIEPGIGEVDPASGSIKVVPKEDGTRWTLHASRGEDSASGEVTVRWLPPTARLLPTDLTPREFLEFRTNIAGADTAVVQPGNIVLDPINGFHPLRLPGHQSETFRLWVGNAVGSDTDQVGYTFAPPNFHLGTSVGPRDWLGKLSSGYVSARSATAFEVHCPGLFASPIRGSAHSFGTGGSREFNFWLRPGLSLYGWATNLAGTVRDSVAIQGRDLYKVVVTAADSTVQRGESTGIHFQLREPSELVSIELRPLFIPAQYLTSSGSWTVSPEATTRYWVVLKERVRGRVSTYRAGVTIRVADGGSSLLAEPMNPPAGGSFDLELQIPPDATSAYIEPGPGTIEPRSQVIQQVAYGAVDYELRVATPRGEEVARLRVEPEDYESVPTVVQALDLTAVAGASSVELQWAVETTEPAHGFVLVRQVEGGTPRATYYPGTATGSWTDPAVESGVEYRYQLQFEAAGERFESDWVAARPIGRLRARLLPNAPNPFNPSTRIWFEIGERANARLQVYDLRGQLVREMDLGEAAPGRGSWVWDGRDGSGRTVSSGVYLVRLLSANSVAARKIVLAK